MVSYVPAEIRRIVAERANYLCEYCLVHEDDRGFGCQIDHIISEKHGGRTDASNLAYACAPCNRAKGSDVGSIAEPTGLLTRLYNPCTDKWHQHFKLDGLRIVGLSESIEDSSEVPQVWRLRSEGSWTSQNGSSVNFLGDGTIFTAREFKRFRGAAGGFHEQFRWNEAQRGTPRPGGALGSEVVGMETAFVTGRRDRRRP